MRINELLEGKNFNDLDFVRQDGENTELDFDLVEDLAFFLHNDDNLYRRHVYPAIHKCVEGFNSGRKVNPLVFKQAALEGYNAYVKQFPIRELPDDLDEELCQKVCDKMYEDFCKHAEEGKYKD
jgi:exoribonuclease II